MDPFRLNLTTLLGKNVSVECRKVRGFRVRGCTCSKFIDLPDTYTRDSILLDRKHIPTHETAQKWNHLKPIVSEIPPMSDIEIGLLIGYNCSTALAPRQVITRMNNEPYAVKTDLSWSIVGTSEKPTSETSALCYQINAKEVLTIAPKDTRNLSENDLIDNTIDVTRKYPTEVKPKIMVED